MADLDIDLNGKTTTLKWKLPVYRKISAEFGGMVPAWRAVHGFDLEAYAKIVAIATERVLPDSLEEVQEAVFTNGMEPLREDLSKFLNRLVSGGTDPAPPDDLAHLSSIAA